MMPTDSSSRSCCTIIFSVAFGMARRKTPNRQGLLAAWRCHKIIGFHFPPITSWGASTGQLKIGFGLLVRLLTFILVSTYQNSGYLSIDLVGLSFGYEDRYHWFRQ